ncbi:hypothetical protein B0T25DRAFT_584277 [Lasiosphaeria hispida]|uniref:Uncharacterized protein n=1 Tax=Lasiosphaeria hispida TaxID=260671 RepID=A0AAJ0MBU2_9PEZI|nr:hypothetical protein B0T25DRAFT_584277 [Lasiosphaeria hispida]
MPPKKQSNIFPAKAKASLVKAKSTPASPTEPKPSDESLQDRARSVGPGPLGVEGVESLRRSKRQRSSSVKIKEVSHQDSAIDDAGYQDQQHGRKRQRTRKSKSRSLSLEASSQDGVTAKHNEPSGEPQNQPPTKQKTARGRKSRSTSAAAQPAQTGQAFQPPPPVVEDAEDAEDAAQTGQVSQPDSVPAAVIKVLKEVPVGAIAYGGGLKSCPLPAIEIEDFGVLNLPVSNEQLEKLKVHGRRFRSKDCSSSWRNCYPKEPTWIFLARYVTINDPRWDEFLQDLVNKAAEYIGLGHKRSKIYAVLSGLYLWDQNSLWRSYSPNIDEPDRAGTLLVTLNKDYTHGGIAMAYGSTKDVFFDPAKAEEDQFFIASHSWVHYDNLPLADGYRLGLSYELQIARHDNLDKENCFLKGLVSRVDAAEVALRSQLHVWAAQVKQGKLANFPLFYVLEDEYEESELKIECLSARDYAKALALRSIKHRRAKGFKMQTYLVTVRATVKNYQAGGGARRIKFALGRAASLGGVLKSHIMKDTIVDERGVPQSDLFVNESRVQKRVSEGMSTTTKTKTCIMMVLEPRNKAGLGL